MTRKDSWLSSGDVSIRGYPKTIRYDLGSQLLAANKELVFDRSKVDECSAIGYTKWIYNKSADAPWPNVCSEALIRSVKRAIRISIGELLERCELCCLRRLTCSMLGQSI